MKKLLCLLVIGFISICTYAQFSRYIIQLKDKAGTPYSISNPSQFLSQRAIDRRTRYGIAVTADDLPVNEKYIDSIRLSGNVTILNVSKWMNQVCIQTTDLSALSKINVFPFVITANPIAASFHGNSPGQKFRRIYAPLPVNQIKPGQNNVTDYYSYGQSYNQIHIHNGNFLHNHNFHGQGMILTVTDDGFYHYQTLPTFDSVRLNNQILGTWDFVANDSNVNNQDIHGMDCFSTIAANMPGTFIGTAPQASFYLFRTEDISSEYPVELQNWLAAVEKADSAGVDVISVSLGYNTFDNSIFDYTYADMNGHSTIIAKAVNIATRKGMLVVAAAGNEGNNSWHYIDTPGDADSALSVGAVDINKQPGYFSSYGPNSSGKIKPDVAAIGVNAYIADQNNGNPYPNNGTSFACPIMAGLTTCLWQAFPEVKNTDIIAALQQSADKAANPDNRVGYGIPDMKKAFVGLIKKLHTQQSSITNCTANISWSAKSASDMNFLVERKLPSDTGFIAISTQSSNTNFVSNNFSYTDDLSSLSSPAAIQYRIKMNIAADTSFYLDSATINYDGNCSNTSIEKISIAPNPVADNLSIEVVRNEPVSVSIVVYSSNGQKIYETNAEQNAGTTIYKVSMKKMARGVYYTSVYINHQKIITKKIVH